jgi:hypothetical protein
MEWTGSQLRQLCVDNNVEFCRALANFGGRIRTYGGDNFTLYFKDGNDHFDVHDNQTGCDQKIQYLSISLASYLSVSQAVEEDTYDCWNAAFRAALDSPKYKQCKKYGGFNKTIQAFKSLLTKELGTIGKVKNSRDIARIIFTVRGIGTVEFWDTHLADSLYIGPHDGKNPGRGWGEVKLDLFGDDLEAKAKEVAGILREGAVKAGKKVQNGH